MGLLVNQAHYTELLSEEHDDLDAKMDALFVEASQCIESKLICASMEEKLRSLNKESMDKTTVSQFG